MGNACCVAARDKMVIPNSSIGVENLRRRSNNNLRHSPNWSFRWDTNRGRVAGEETSLSWLSSDGISGEGSEFKFESAFVSNASSDGSPSLDSFRTQHHTLQKSPASELSFARNSSMDTVFEQKENESATQLSLSLSSQPSTLATSSPLSSQSYFNPSSSSTTLKPIPQQQPPRLSNQISETDSSSEKDWSLQAFSEMMSYDKRISSCGACSRPLTERSLWNNNNNNQKMFVTSNELSVSAILACGHVYHSECLEEMTLETDKFDPLCPVCTLGEKKTTMELKAKQNKRVRNRVLDDDFVMFDREVGKSPKVFESSSAKQPFLARRFSFGSRSNCKSTTQENQSVRKKGFFWTKSSKI